MGLAGDRGLCVLDFTGLAAGAFAAMFPPMGNMVPNPAPMDVHLRTPLPASKQLWGVCVAGASSF